MENEQQVIGFKRTEDLIFDNESRYTPQGENPLHPEVQEEEIFEKRLQTLIQHFVLKNNFKNVGNFYVDSPIKQENLKKYFKALNSHNPEWMLLGEAPGIHGCVKTGIPFTSQRLIMDGSLNKHFPNTQFIADGNKAEASSTIIWGSINSLSKPPVLWNAFPLHPTDEVGGNRPPTREELEWGMEILKQVLFIFPDVKIVTVGRKAEGVCKSLNLQTFAHLNHPSRKANLFREQFKACFSL
ncbi:hypothetical protein J2T12_002379 [Paenibacillus anaericanus]|uniref:uracil-DNA glycosylase n=1 Tax=Paenibacillus anaericanus TaxID=170367 RepID=UPI002780434E|nr:uracil-DNA glycosylase [Paenibacillus anaericanus]MDQ0088969.1 hypothetical protein [Paenibacillus anaericanus]